MTTSAWGYFDLLRHGRVDGAAALYGKTDIGLSEPGWQQLTQQIRSLETPQVIISSPLKRCREFAEYCAQHWQRELVIEDDLRECDFGQFDGIAFDNLQTQWPELEAFWDDPLNQPLPGAESLADFHQRVSHCWQRLITNYSGQRNLLICHGGVIRQILAYVLAVDWRNGHWYSQLQINYASLSQIALGPYPQAKPIVTAINQQVAAEHSK